MPVPDTLTGLAFDHVRKELVVTTGNGLAHIVSAAGHTIEVIDTASDGPSNLQWILGAVEILGDVYAYGMSRQVYRRSGPARWERIDQNMRTNDVAGIRSVAGHSNRELYGVGFKGEIWVYDGLQWIEVATPTNVKLEAVVCAPDGTVYACGGAGVLLKGRGESWTQIPQNTVRDTVWSATWFKGALYLATTTGLFYLKDNDLVLVPGLPSGASTFGYLSGADGAMWSVGHSDLIEFEGTQWHRIEPPEVAVTPRAEAP